MNTKLALITFLLTNTSVAVLPVLAKEGGVGTQGGGQAIVDISGIPHLRDIYDKCQWDNMSYYELVESTPYAIPLLNALKESHWIFGKTMENEMKRLKVCLTGTLKKVNVDDKEGVTAYRAKGKNVQIGIRVNEDVYLDYERFKQMPEIEQALTLFHETMHSFIDYSVEGRNHAVRTATYAVLDNYYKRFKSWATTIEKTSLSIPLSTKDFDEPTLKDKILKVWNLENQKQVRYPILEEISETLNGLYYKDRQEIFESYNEDLAQAKSYIRDIKAKELKKLLYPNDQSVKKAFGAKKFKLALLEHASEQYNLNDETLSIIIGTFDNPESMQGEAQETASAECDNAECANVLEKLFKAVIEGRLKLVTYSDLNKLGLPVVNGLRAALEIDLKNLNQQQKQKRINRAKSVFDFYTQNGVDLNQPLIPVQNDDESDVFLPVIKNVTAFDYALGSNIELAAYLMAMPTADLKIIENSDLKNSEQKRIDFIYALLPLNQTDALTKVLSVFELNAFKRMQIAGYMRAEGFEAFAKIIETTKPTTGLIKE